MQVTEKKMRRKANECLAQLCTRYHASIPIGEIDSILAAHLFAETEPAIYCGRDGCSNEQVGPKTWLCLSWHKMDTTGRYEIVAYLS